MNNTQHNNSIETLVTERLVLRALEENDAKALLNTIGDREAAWWSDDFRRHNLDEAIEYINWGNEGDDILLYGLFKKGSDDVIGYVQIKLPAATGMQDGRELGYAISKDYRRQGYMTEAVKVVCNHLFQNETIKFVTLEILPENLPSLGVARKCGFSLVVEPEEKKHRRFLDDKSLNLYVLNKQ